PICAVLTEHGWRVGSSTYYDAKDRPATRRERRDEELIDAMAGKRAKKPFLRRFGARKMWLHLRAQGFDVARCTVERLYRRLGWRGASRAKQPRTPVPDPQTDRADERVNRRFWASIPDRLWAADFTYVKTRAGMVYVAFVIDIFSRRILGWKTDTAMTTNLVLDTLDMALDTRRREGVRDFTGLTHHNDAGSQYTSVAFTDRLAEAGIDASVGTVADAYDNALAESTIGLYKSELIDDTSWHRRDDVELATLEWVYFYNNERPHGSIDDLTPTQAEE